MNSSHEKKEVEFHCDYCDGNTFILIKERSNGWSGTVVKKKRCKNIGCIIGRYNAKKSQSLA